MAITDIFRKWSRKDDDTDPPDFSWNVLPEPLELPSILSTQAPVGEDRMGDALKHIDWGALRVQDLGQQPGRGYASGGYVTSIDPRHAVNGPFPDSLKGIVSQHELDAFRKLQEEYERHTKEQMRLQRIQDASNTLIREGKLVLDPAVLATALHNAGASIELIHETADWLEEACPGFDRMQFLTSIDWDKKENEDG